MTLVTLRIVNSVSCVTRINHEIHFSWQAQYLVSLDNDTCYSATPRIVDSVSCVTKINHEIHFSWQAQYLVSLDNDTCYSAHCK